MPTVSAKSLAARKTIKALSQPDQDSVKSRIA